LETQFKYQVSPELAEKIAVEQFDILSRVGGIKLRYFPVGTGFLLALFFFLVPDLWIFGGTFYRYRFLPVGGYVFATDFLSVPLGFIFGFGFGFLIGYFVRWRILVMARSEYKKTGPDRSVSWNSESFTFQSPFYETKVPWKMIDKIKIGFLGVYGFLGRKAFFAIPKEAFPSNATPEDLLKAWQTGKSRTPITA
jgi:hypothetical protein